MLTPKQEQNRSNFVKELYQLMQKYKVGIDEGEVNYDYDEVWNFTGQPNETGYSWYVDFTHIYAYEDKINKN